MAKPRMRCHAESVALAMRVRSDRLREQALARAGGPAPLALSIPVEPAPTGLSEACLAAAARAWARRRRWKSW